MKIKDDRDLLFTVHGRTTATRTAENSRWVWPDIRNRSCINDFCYWNLSK
jgi:hypothetical protein